MLATGHQVMGMTWGVIALTILPFTLPVSDPLTTILFLLAVLFGAYLPDIDSPNSTIGRRLYPVALYIIAGSLVSLYLFPELTKGLYANYTPVVVAIFIPVILVFSTHRTWTHSLSFIMTLVLYFQLISRWLTIPDYIQIAILIGVVSHIFGDFITKQGVPLLYPFSHRRFRFILTFRTGSIMEKALILGLLLLNVYLFMGI